jgi:hypothetical protein
MYEEILIFLRKYKNRHISFSYCRMTIVQSQHRQTLQGHKEFTQSLNEALASCPTFCLLLITVSQHQTIPFSPFTKHPSVSTVLHNH